LEEQVKQGKIKKKEEAAKKREAQREAEERERKLAERKAAIQKAAEEERRLKAMLEQEDSSEDEDGPEVLSDGNLTPTQHQEDSFGTSAVTPPAPPPPPPLPPAVSVSSPVSHQTQSPAVSAPAPDENRNPFAKHLQAASPGVNGGVASPIASPMPTIPPPVSEGTNNPFFKQGFQDSGPALPE